MQRKEGIPERRNTGKEGCKKGGICKVKEGCRKGGTHDRRCARKKVYVKERRDAGK